MPRILTCRPQDSSTAFKRVGLASLLFAVTRPRDARAATVARTALRLTMFSGPQEILMRDIQSVSLEREWVWGGVRIRTACGDTVVSGLPRREAATLAAAAEETRIAWWREFLGEHADALAITDARLADLEAPRCYVRRRAFSSLVEEVRQAASAWPQWWPDQLDDEPAVQTVKRIRAFLSDPAAARRRANQAFLRDELARSRGFLDRVEARPLTEEQRRAVCVDDDRNLVVAGAGSGKTSVMVAKAGWIVERGDRRPGDLLLLAFARNARRELAQRVEQRLGASVARAMNVQTFHSLGLSIIGEAEGRRPALAKAAGDDAALLALLKGIITELQDHPRHGRTLVRWLAYAAPPYRGEHEFLSLGEYSDYLRNHEIRSLQGESVKELRGVLDCELPLPERGPLRVRTPLRARHLDREEEPIQARLLSSRRGDLHRALCALGERGHAAIHRPGQVHRGAEVEAGTPRGARHDPHSDLQPRTRQPAI